MSNKFPLMAHLVIGYPDLEASYQTAVLYEQYNMELIEFQVPFSHPMADGAVISQANVRAIENHITLESCLTFLRDFRSEFPQQQVMVMSYLNKVFHYGIEQFCDTLQALQIRYLIVPDLNYDSPFAQKIYEHPYVQLVPVIAANIPDFRLKELLFHQPDYVYVMADYKITGSRFSIHQQMKDLIVYIRKHSRARVGIGFGIAEKWQLEEVLKVADFAIVGSAFVQAQVKNRLQAKIEEIIM